MNNLKSMDVNSYLSFKLGEEEFAINVNKVINILELTRITKVPKSPFYMKGVINLRGMVLPVIDTRLKIGMTETVYTDKTCIIIMELDFDEQKVCIGSLVDDVKAVLEIDLNQIEPPPSIGSKYKSSFILGMAKVDEDFIMLVDMEKIFSEDGFISQSENSKVKELIY